jgi:hypothetical protein
MPRCWPPTRWPRSRVPDSPQIPRTHQRPSQSRGGAIEGAGLLPSVLRWVDAKMRNVALRLLQYVYFGVCVIITWLKIF